MVTYFLHRLVQDSGTDEESYCKRLRLAEFDGLDLFLFDHPQNLKNAVTYFLHRLVQDSGPDAEGYLKRLGLA